MTVQCVQWIHSKLVAAATIQDLAGPNPFTWCSELFPYVVPSGYWLGIVDMALSSKYTDGPSPMGGSAIASYLALSNVVSVPDNVGYNSFKVPLVVPEGKTLNAQIINNDSNQQWMSSVITGLLVPKVEGQTWRDAFAGLFPL